jgi:hypothetical protein
MFLATNLPVTQEAASSSLVDPARMPRHQGKILKAGRWNSECRAQNSDLRIEVKRPAHNTVTGFLVIQCACLLRPATFAGRTGGREFSAACPFLGKGTADPPPA